MFTKDDLVYSYTRKQALEDGTLIDLTKKATDYGFKIPFACTDLVWQLIEWTHDDSERKPGTGQCTDGRLHDVLTLAMMAARKAGDDNRTNFRVLMVPRDGTGINTIEVSFHLVVGPGDDAEPVMTLMGILED